jgi:hypothetical protein
MNHPSAHAPATHGNVNSAGPTAPQGHLSAAQLPQPPTLRLEHVGWTIFALVVGLPLAFFFILLVVNPGQHDSMSFESRVLFAALGTAGIITVVAALVVRQRAARSRMLRLGKVVVGQVVSSTALVYGRRQTGHPSGRYVKQTRYEVAVDRSDHATPIILQALSSGQPAVNQSIVAVLTLSEHNQHLAAVWDGRGWVNVNPYKLG